jgi:hypothetical protein
MVGHMTKESTKRRNARGVFGAVALTVATAAFFLFPLSTPSGAAGGPAVTVKGTACSMLGADANGNPIDGGIGVVANKVENGNNVVLKCNAAPGVLINLSGRTQTYRGFQCFIRSPVDGTRLETFDTGATVTVNGGGQATCKYSKR